MPKSCKHGLPASPLPFEKMELKKRNTDGVVPPRYVLTQGSLHYRLATLGYQKRNPYGVRLFSWKRSLWAPLPFEKMELKKRNTDGVVLHLTY